MKKIKYGIAFKTAAFILSFITAVSAIVGIFCAGAMFEYSFYARSCQTVKTDIIISMLRDEAYRIAYNYIDYENFCMHNYFDERFSDSNLYYSVSILSDDTGEAMLITENMDENDAFCITTVEHGFNPWEYDDTYLYSESGFHSENQQKVVPLSDKGIHETEAWEYDYTDYSYTASVTLAVKKSLPANDKYSLVSKTVERGYSMRYGIFLIIILSVLFTIALWIYLFCAVGRSSENGELVISPFDRIPFDLLFAMAILIVILSFVFIVEFYPSGVPSAGFLLLFGFAVVIYSCALISLLNLASQLKKHILLKGTLCFRFIRGIYRILMPLFKKLGYIFSNINLIAKAAVICLAAAIAELAVIISFSYEPDILILFWLFGNIAAIGALMLISVCFAKLKKGGQEIAKGNVDYEIDTENMPGSFRSFGQSLNHISVVMQNAVNEKMKSERMKTELITNVSHDIKTPLTSIINYVDLIKKENTENPVINEYIGVLDKQSKRLKKLIEDLVEASKASSGALKVNLSRCNLGILLSQAVGEYEDRLRNSGLTHMISLPEDSVYIMADGRYLWRIFDNLMNNICKYTQPDTRVYIDLFASKNQAGIIFKNISRYPLNISGAELMERFVRGDSSRSTDGSGLGLSIAQSLTELQQGKMNIWVDGDLFKVILTFPILPDKPKDE